MPEYHLGDAEEIEPESRGLTWAILLAHWTHLARAVSVLPPDKEGRSWSASVAPAITLHAIAMALGDLEKLDPDERALALDRAQILIERETGRLNQTWMEMTMPDELASLIVDARAAFERASYRGGGTLADHPGA